MAAHNIEPAYTPTYSSWLNAIEAHFTSLKKFAIGGTDDPSHEYRRWRIARYLTWRNKEKGSSKAALAQFSRVRLYRQLACLALKTPPPSVTKASGEPYLSMAA
jgi:DDE superfamily endonuclease